MTSNSTGMYLNRLQKASTKLEKDEGYLQFQNTLGSLWVFNELVREEAWQIESYGNYPCGENEDETAWI